MIQMRWGRRTLQRDSLSPIGHVRELPAGLPLFLLVPRD